MAAAAWGWLLDHESKLFGIVLGIMSADQWRTFVTRLDTYWVYLANGILATPLLSLAVTFLSAAYMSIVALILLRATRPLARYEELAPNVLAVLAGFGIYWFGLLTPSGHRMAGLYLPLFLLVMGAAIVLWGLVHLRRAFSVVPQARTVVTSGPYAYIRHPMYLGNILTIAGLALLLSTLEALVLAFALTALQVCRARYEDRLLSATLEDYGGYMSRVDSFIPRWRRSAAMLSLVLAALIFVLVGPDSSQAQSSNPQLAAKCRAWHQKALAGRWFTQQEASEFAQTDSIQEAIISSIPQCRDFFAAQAHCQSAAIEVMVNAGDGAITKELRSAAANLVRLIDSDPACKAIAGFSQVCTALRTYGNGKGVRLTTRQRSLLSECADASIGEQTSGLIRGAL
ncbi:MAG: isoprenylcysteine carboxylmethyltransferase family protein [Hyphomicrobiaceae bacterium]